MSRLSRQETARSLQTGGGGYPRINECVQQGCTPVKVAQKPVTALTAQQVQALLSTTTKYPTLRLRVLLAVTTGLRRGDVEAIRVGNTHFD